MIKHYTDIDPTVDFVFSVNEIDCENSGKKIVSKDHCNVHQLFIVTSLQLLLPVMQTIFFSVPRFSMRKN